jgi:hypothetical protein
LTGERKVKREDHGGKRKGFDEGDLKEFRKSLDFTS